MFEKHRDACGYRLLPARETSPGRASDCTAVPPADWLGQLAVRSLVLDHVQGKLSLAKAKAILDAQRLQVTAVPSAIDLTDCPYMWPYCLQSLYAGAQPVIFNATILNSMHVYGNFTRAPRWTPSDEGGALLDVLFTHSDALWPWSGHVSVFLRVKARGAGFTGSARGTIDFEITSPPAPGQKVRALLPCPARASKLTCTDHSGDIFASHTLQCRAHRAWTRSACPACMAAQLIMLPSTCRTRSATPCASPSLQQLSLRHRAPPVSCGTSSTP